MRKFHKQFPTIKESSVREFKKRYENELKEAKQENRELTKSLPKYRSGNKVGRPLLLGEFDAQIQSYITALANRGSVISRSVATSEAKALIKQHPGEIADLDLEPSYWAQSLFRRMGFVRRRHTATKVDIPDGARKEIEYVFL